jgi:hypothetical protein
MFMSKQGAHAEITNKKDAWLLFTESGSAGDSSPGEQTESEGPSAPVVASGGSNPILDIVEPVERKTRSSSSTCPDCSGSIEQVPPGEEMIGHLNGQLIELTTEPGDRWCSTCSILVCEGGEIVR